MRIGDKIPMLLKVRGMNAAEMARRTGIPSARFSEWKDPDGRRTATLAQALRVARELRVSLEYLADDEMDDPPAPDVTPDERHLIETIRAMELPKDVVLRSLAYAARAIERERAGLPPFLAEPPPQPPARRRTK